MTLLSFGLLALFVWLMVYFFLQRTPDVHFVLLRISDYGQFDAPPIPFAAQDHAALLAAVPEPKSEFAHTIDDTESDNSLARLGEACEKVPRGAVLVVCITAHGVSADGKAYLLASNYDPDAGPQPRGRIAVSDLLKTLSGAPARQIVLVLDAGRLDQDLTQGMIVNEFPRLVEAEVKALRSPEKSLYVMLASSYLEQSQVSFREQRSAFNYFLVNGWQGDAEGVSKSDDQLMLGEWFAYVRDRTSAWAWNASGKTRPQTPVLLRGGVGQVELAEADKVLLRRVRKPKEQVKAEDKKEPVAEKKVARLAFGRSLAWAQAPTVENKSAEPAASDKKADDKKLEPAPTPPAPPPTKPEPVAPAGPAAEPAPADDETTASLAVIHDARGALEASAFGSANAKFAETPADYAPHLWRQLVRQSSSYEKTALGGGSTANANSDLNATAQTLPALRQVWQNSAAVKSLANAPELSQAITARDNAWLHLREFTRLASYPPATGWPTGHLARVRELITATQQLDLALSQPVRRNDRGRLVVGAEKSAGPETLLIDVAAQVDRLSSELRTAIVAARSDSSPANALLDELLHTSLLHSAERRDVRAAWRMRQSQVPLLNTADLALPRDSDIENWRAKRIEQLKLTTELELAVAQALSTDLPAPLTASLEKAKAIAGAGLDMAHVHELNDCGGTLVQWNQQASAQVTEFANVRNPAPGDIARAERLIRGAIDSDNATIATAWRNVLALRVYPVQTPVQRLGISGPINTDGAPRSEAIIPLSSSGSTFTWQLGPATQLLPETTLQLEYDEKLLSVEQPGGRKLASRSGFNLKASDKNASGFVPFSLKVMPRPGEESGKQATLTLRVAPDKQVTLVNTFQLPEPKWLDLFVRGWPGTVADLAPQAPTADAEGLLAWQPATGTSGLTKVLLQPFPSGSSPYALRVGNRSQKVRKLTYRVWTFANDPKQARSRSWQPWEASGELAPGAVKLSETNLEVPADGTLDLSLFPAPPAPPAAPATAPPAPPAAPPLAPAWHVERGIVCEFVSTDGFAPPQRVWFDVAPLHPSQYVDVNFTPDPGKRSLASKVALLADGPRRAPTHDCEVRWEKLDTLDPLKPAGRADTRNLLLNPLTISEVLPPGQDIANVVLSIDGYPRALEYRAPLFGQAERIQVGRSYLRLVLLTQDKEQKPVTITDRNRYFQTLDTIDFWAMADVPPPGSGADEYLFRVYIAQANDAGEQGEDTSREYKSDRTFSIELAKAEAATPRFLLRSRVDDLRGTLKLAGLTNRVVTIKAEILSRDREGLPQGKPLVREDRLVIDNEAPTLAAPLRELSVTIGQPLKLAVKLRDEVAGVREVLWSWQVDPAGQLKEPQTLDVRALSKTDPTDTRDCEATLELPTKEITPGTRKLRMQAVDRCGNVMLDPIELAVKFLAPAGDPMPEKKDKNTLVVTVQRDGKPERGISVAITGPEARTLTTDASGVAKFEDLPAGDYTIQTSKNEVFVKNKIYKADAVKAAVTPPPKPAAEATLMLK